MNFLKFPLNHQDAGTLVRVTLRGVESDVFLVDRSNLTQLERGADFRYTGGHYKQSPVLLQVPASADWTAVVIPSSGRVEASVEVLA